MSQSSNPHATARLHNSASLQLTHLDEPIIHTYNDGFKVTVQTSPTTTLEISIPYPALYRAQFIQSTLDPT